MTDCDRIVAHTPQRKRRARRDALEVDGERGDAHPRPERKVSSIVREPDLGLSAFTEKTFRADDRRHYRREPFLFEMDQVIPWATVEALVTPHYPKGGRGRHPLPMGSMLRIYCHQQWFNLSDPQAEDRRYDSASRRRFARIDLRHDTVPDETTICKCRHLLDAYRPTSRMFDAVKALLEGRQTTQGNPWYFGMKGHLGTDRRGVIHALTTTDAATADIAQWPYVLHGQEATLHGDKARYEAEDTLQWEPSGVRYLVSKSGKRTASWDAIHRPRSRVYALGTLANLFRLRHRLRPQGTSCRRARRHRPKWADVAP